jgi:HK97 family phage prohead protease
MDVSFDVTLRKGDVLGHDATFVMSSAAPDRVKDTIEPSAYDRFIGQKLIALWQHDADRPIGFWNIIRNEAGKLVGGLKFATTPLAQMARTLIEDGVPLGASIGFRGKGTPREKGGIHYSSIDIMECSIVSVPCHPHAIQIAKQYGITLPAAEQPLSAQQKLLLSRAAAAVEKSNHLLRLPT